MTQKQAAEALGRSAEWVHSAETGRRGIDRTSELACWAVEKQMDLDLMRAMADCPVAADWNLQIERKLRSGWKPTLEGAAGLAAEIAPAHGLDARTGVDGLPEFYRGNLKVAEVWPSGTCMRV
jgi:hypothetical protein